MSKKIQALINGQTIRIDNHKRGDGAPIKFKSGIHVHKKMNKYRYAGAEIEIPLASDSEMTITMKGNQKQQYRLKTEIQNAFKNREKRRAFVKDVINSLDRLCTYKDEVERLQSFLTSANNIARHFDLHEVQELIQNNQDIFETLHVNDDNKDYYLLQDLQDKNIRIGDSQQLVEKWDDNEQ